MYTATAIIILYMTLYILCSEHRVLSIDAVTVLVVMVFNVVVLVGSRVEPTDTVGERVGQNWTAIYKRKLKINVGWAGGVGVGGNLMYSMQSAVFEWRS